MAPDAGWNTYRLYKEGTTKLTTWLVDNALRCRADVQTNAARNADSSEGSSKSKYTVPLSQFVSMAKTIVDSIDPRVRVSQNILALIKYTISLRKHAANFFSKMASANGTGELLQSNVGHQHFIEILEQVSNILDPSNQENEPVGDETDLPNMFGALTVEEPASEGMTPSESPHQQAKGVCYEPESDGFDLAFAIFTFFDDLHSIREFISGVWVDYANGELDHNIREVLNPRTVSLLKADHYGVYRPEQDRSALSQEEQDREDLIVTMNLLQEFTKLSRARVHLPVEDELTRGIRIMTDTCDARQMPMFVGFAFQILIDIHNNLRDRVVLPLGDLQNHARRIDLIMDDYLRRSKHAHIHTWAPRNNEALRMIKETAKEWALEDTIAGLWLPLPKGAPKMESFYLLKNHPVLAGLLVFHLNVRLQEAGITCNAWGSVLYPAHLYNACQQSGGLDAPWRDIEYMIETHAAKRLFVGVPPSEASDYIERFVFALGGSASNFARNRRPGGGHSLIVQSKKGPRGLKTTTPVRDTFESRYVGGESQAVLSKANLVAMLSVAMKSRRTSLPGLDMKALLAQVTDQPDLTQIQVLQVVREGVAGEEHHLVFDYIGLHFRGYKLLRMLHTHLSGQLAQYFGPNSIENESELPFIIGYVFEIVAGSDRNAQTLRLELGGSRILQTAAETMKAFLEDGDNARKGLINAKVWTGAVLYHDATDTLDEVFNDLAS
ncbi:hypothetical protein BST61_g5916 [Cercospora zeina]